MVTNCCCFSTWPSYICSSTAVIDLGCTKSVNSIHKHSLRVELPLELWACSTTSLSTAVQKLLAREAFELSGAWHDEIQIL